MLESITSQRHGCEPEIVRRRVYFSRRTCRISTAVIVRAPGCSPSPPESWFARRDAAILRPTGLTLAHSPPVVLPTRIHAMLFLCYDTNCRGYERRSTTRRATSTARRQTCTRTRYRATCRAAPRRARSCSSLVSVGRRVVVWVRRRGSGSGKGMQTKNEAQE